MREAKSAKLSQPAPCCTQPLMEAGLDSLGATELQAALGMAFSLELPATTTIDYPTSAALAAHIGLRLGGLPAHAGMHCSV